jgi:glycerol-3-phosphate dehydrogenase (NAD(P)+)
VTCWHPSGRNRLAGELIARGRTPEEAVAEIGRTVEGLTTAPVLRDLAHRVGVEVPITEDVCTVLGGTDLRTARQPDGQTTHRGVSARRASR